MSHLFSHLPRRVYTLLALSLTLVTIWFITSGPATRVANASKLTPDQPATSSEEPAIPGEPITSSQQPASRPAAQDQAEWTIMLYQDADDETLEEDILMTSMRPSAWALPIKCNIVAQVDRYDGAFDGMDDWTSTKRFYVTQDDDLSEIGSEELEDLGEINMADGQSLVDFITWAAENFPANKYALILSDHGAGLARRLERPRPRRSGAR